MMLITPTELQELTGYRRHAEQIRWLQRNGIRHFIRRDGSPAVLPLDLQQAGAQRQEPRFEAI